ncbi:hypothetical protein PLICRDRAFT_94715 [Plicaturopsis crispa FD-325 SS-3]|uniref:F-box domain-containing protein n=1 Tax=Plicaturopsis crispa FD-325 SS-3 TaxID=944288 RepID=A0A0C9SYL5_PLICR|nr:hypothetical protein PLICRDRAFT_94715 [Plicaturopsis crispa FD-325 SS-3]
MENLLETDLDGVHLQLQELDLGSACAHAANLHNRGAPISLLPTEILSDIFMCNRAADDPDRLPLLPSVTHVSQHWRRVALATPNLWTLMAGKRMRHPKLFDACLDRSGTCLLDVRLDQWADVTLCEKLFRHSTRWRSFECHVSTLSIAHLPTPNLRHFHVKRVVARAPISALSLSADGAFLGDYSRLSILRLENVSITRHHLPASTTFMLEVLELTHVFFENANDIVMALSMTPALKKLTLHDVILASSHTLRQTSKVNLASLTHLTLGALYTDSLGCVFNQFNMPSLRSLEIRTLDVALLVLVCSWHSTTTPMYPSVDSLVAKQCTVPENFMRAFPNVVHFTLRHTRFANLTVPLAALGLRALRRSENNPTPPPPLWPHLKSVTILHPQSLCRGSLAKNLVSSRIFMGYPLSNLAFMTKEPRPGKYAEEIQWLREHVSLELGLYETV